MLRNDEKDLAAHLRSNFMIVGWLSRDGATGWTCRTAWAPHSEHRLQMAVPGVTGRSTAWAGIGTADPQRGIIIERAHLPGFPASGRLSLRPKPARPVVAARNEQGRP